MPHLRETITLPDGAQNLGNITVNEDLGVNFPEPTNVSLLTAPLDIYRTVTDDTERFDLVSRHDPVDGNQLLSVLAEAAPYKSLPGLMGVISDWNVTDRAETTPETDNIFDPNKLVRLHSQLGWAWNEFVKSQPAFLGTLEDVVVPNFYWSDNAQQLLTAVELADHAMECFFSNVPTSITELAQSLEKIGLSGQYEVVIEQVRAILNQNRTKKSSPRNVITSPGTVEDKFRGWPKSKRREFTRNFAADLSEEERQELIDGMTQNAYDKLELPDGWEVFYPSRLVEGSLDELYEKRSEVIIGNFKAEFIRLITPHGRVRDLLVPGSIKPVIPVRRMAPIISWEKSKRYGTRRLVIERQAVFNKSITFFDGVLGATALAYLSPNIRKDWQQRKGLRGADRTQEMGPAQLPVLALMHRHALLDSELVQTVEHR